MKTFVKSPERFKVVIHLFPQKENSRKAQQDREFGKGK